MLVGRVLMNKGVLVSLVVTEEADVGDVVVVMNSSVTPVCAAGVLLLMTGCFLSQPWLFILKHNYIKLVKMGDSGTEEQKWRMYCICSPQLSTHCQPSPDDTGQNHWNICRRNMICSC